MIDHYLAFKFTHVLIAIVALGSGAAVAVLLGFFADDATHRAFVLRTSRRLLQFLVVPGYVLMLVSGMWMGHIAKLLDAHWTEAAMNIWGFGAICFFLLQVAVHLQIKYLDSQGAESRAFRRAALLRRLSGTGAALIVLFIVYLMVFKPA